MNEATRQNIQKVLDAWASASVPWKAEAVAAERVSDMCILATGACASVLSQEFGLDVAVLAVDLFARNEKTAEYEPIVEHPEGANAIQAGVYVGHVVIVVKDDRSFIVDAEVGVVAPFNGTLAKGEADGCSYMFRARAEHREFTETEAWSRRGAAAAAVNEQLSGGSS